MEREVGFLLVDEGREGKPASETHQGPWQWHFRDGKKSQGPGSQGELSLVVAQNKWEEVGRKG